MTVRQTFDSINTDWRWVVVAISLTSPPTLGVVERQMSFLFCDIEGFTTVRSLFCAAPFLIFD